MKVLLLFITFILIVSSCDNHSINPINDDNNLGFVLIAGQVINDSIDYTELAPSIMVKGTRTGVDTNYFYNDSCKLDLNNDGIDDISFKYFEEFIQPNCDCVGIDCCLPWVRNECLIKLLSNVEIASIDLVGSGPNRLNIGDTINNSLIWVYSNKYQMFSAPGMPETWDIDHYNSFMGFRFVSDTDTLYGWIRINTFYSSRIGIYDYAIEKRSKN